jgi:SEC-C motif-containing protein
MTTCPCGTGREFEECCGPLISGKPAPTAEALMRSRYSAFTRGNLDYLRKTSGGEALLKFDRAELGRSLPGAEWLGLDIKAVEDGGKDDIAGVVTFEVRFRQNGRIYKQTERSEFRRIDLAWRYCKGDVDLTSGQVHIAQIGRNELCPCGSGKKYKKCCGV